MTKTLNVTPVNDAPVLGGIEGTVGYTNDDPAVAVAPAATVQDLDNANLAGGKLTIRVVAGSDTSNRIELGGGLFTLDAENNVLRDGVAIGTLNANGGRGFTKFEVTFNAEALPGYVQQLLRAIRFRTEGGASTVPRELSFKLTDGLGGSATATKTVEVS